MTGTKEKAAGRKGLVASRLVEPFEIHAGVEAGNLIGVSVEHLCGDGVGQKAGVDAALAGLCPAWMVDSGIYVGVETVLVGVDLVPGGFGLLVGEVEFDDGLAVLESVLPRHDNSDGRAVLVGQGLAVAAEGQQGEGVHGFVEAKAFGVGPVVAARERHLFAIGKGDELNEFGAGKRLAEADELGEGVAVPGDDHGPSFDATVAVDAAFDGAVLHDAVDVEGQWLFDEAGDLDGPGAGLEGVCVSGGVGFVGAELVEVVVGSGFVEGGLRLSGGVLAWCGVKVICGMHFGCGVYEAGDVSGRDDACSEGGGSGEESATGLLMIFEGLFRGDVGGADVGVETVGLVEEHLERSLFLQQR